MKPIREWTLQEVKDYCSDKNNKCEECVLKYACDDFSSDAPSGWTLTPSTYKEEIEWHSYPEEEPPITQKNYLVQTKHGSVMAIWLYDKIPLSDIFIPEAQPVRWAEMPKGRSDVNEY